MTTCNQSYEETGSFASQVLARKGKGQLEASSELGCGLEVSLTTLSFVF